MQAIKILELLENEKDPQVLYLKLKEAATIEIQAAELKAAGQLASYKGAKAYIKAATRRDVRDIFRGYYYGGPDKKQLFCDGYSLIELNHPVIVNDLKEVTGAAGIYEIMVSASKNQGPDVIIDYADITSTLKIEKAADKNKKVIKQIGDQFFDYELLAGVLRVLGVRRAKFIDSITSMNPAFITSEAGRAVLLPVRMS